MQHGSNPRRSLLSKGGCVVIAGWLLAAAPMAMAQDKFKPHPGGFWKIRPPTSFKGEFNGEDIIGLAFKQHISTDCSIVWKYGEKFYCFSSQMSSQFVQEDPDQYLPKAIAFWSKEHPDKAADATPGNAGSDAGASR